MLDHENLLSFNFYTYGGVQTGDHHGMRYRIKRTGDKPDFSLTASVWPEPFSYDVTPKEKITEKVFAYSEDGRRLAIDWLIEQYTERKEEWDKVPSLLNAML